MKIIWTLLVLLCVLVPARAQQEDARLLNVDPTYLAPYVTLGYVYAWRSDGRQQSRPNLEVLYPFGLEETQAITVRAAYDFVGEVESVEDVELLYTWLFDHQDAFWQTAVLHVNVPAAGDPLVGGTWAVEGEYNTRWQIDDELLWINELHFNHNLTTGVDSIEGFTELTRLLSDDYLVTVGGRARQELTLGGTALAARVGVGRRLDDTTNLNLSLQQSLNTQARASFNDFSIELNLTRGF